MAIQGQGETLAKLGSVLSVLNMLVFAAVVVRNRNAIAITA